MTGLSEKERAVRAIAYKEGWDDREALLQAAREEPSQEVAGSFEAWLQTFEEDVVQTEYGYEPGEFTVYPDDWRQAWEDGLTPSAAFRRACEALTEARKADDALQAANALRIKAEDRAAVAEAKLAQEGAGEPVAVGKFKDALSEAMARTWSGDGPAATVHVGGHGPMVAGYCKACGTQRSAAPCHKCGGELKTPHPDWEEPSIPDVTPIRALAREVGYAIGEHGSKERDLDLIAAPWTADAVSPQALADHIAKGINGHILAPTNKPAGRWSCNIQVDGWFKLIDLSVSPPNPQARIEALEAEVRLLEEVCTFYANDEDQFLGDGEPYGTIPTEVGLKARSARSRFVAREAALNQGDTPPTKTPALNLTPEEMSELDALQRPSIPTMISALRVDEGDSITLLCDNPEGPPNNAVECCGEWTGWQARRFEGETLDAAIQAAFDARAAGRPGDGHAG